MPSPPASLPSRGTARAGQSSWTAKAPGPYAPGRKDAAPVVRSCDRTGSPEARGLKAYAGASPITRASGKKSSITRRWVKNDRLNTTGYLWAFYALRASPGMAHYRRRRDDHGDWHAAAQRNLFNRMLGQLFHCLQNQVIFDDWLPFPRPIW